MKRGDIEWRDINEDRSIFNKDMWFRAILVLTDIGNEPDMARITMCSRIDPSTNKDRELNEKVEYYAFL
jgi:hypothetical protein